ncbi:hemolysin family protein [Sphingomicrobium marinum]|uniref:hemolysin family protein n=1 Tax=Sphingomicrobium marinum TaxID=1227950 RepID=UPI0022405B96|nr:hemolysin family protein [Sphingomicrobium marinum]
MASRPDEPNRLWRGMRSLFLGDDDKSLREEIEEAIDEADAEPVKVGDLSPHERQMLRNLLHFGDRTAGDICVPRGEIVSVQKDISFEQLVEEFAEAEHSRLPVTGEGLDDIVGMLHIKDVFKAKLGSASRGLDDMLREPLFVPESMGVIDILGRMRAERVHLAIVVDEFGGTEGVVTIEDVVEEIVGEIEDEHDEMDSEPQLIMVADGIWDADARVEMDEIIEKVDEKLAWEEDDVDTIGGLAFLLAERILDPGESVSHPSGWRLECVAAEQRRVTRIRLHAPEEAMDEAE